MNQHNFIIPNADTDSITICKPDGGVFTKEEQDALLKEINSILPSKIVMDHDGFYPTMVILKTKNYIMYDGKKLKYKGSAVKATTKEPALKEFIKRIIDAIIQGKDNYVEIYNEYIKEAMAVTDIRRWVSKRGLTDKVFTNERANERKVRDAIAGTEYVEGDKVYLFYLPDETLCLAENFKGEYDKERLVKKIFDTSKVFNTVIPEGTFINYSLKRNKKALEEITGQTTTS